MIGNDTLSQVDIDILNKVGIGRPSPNDSYHPTVVYQARIRKSITIVAAKSIDIMRKDEAYRETDFLRVLRHPNIIGFFGWYKTDHHFWLIVEYCPGGTLQEIYEKDKYIPEDVIRMFGSDLISALLYLHSKKIVARDLQPRNLVIDEDGTLKIGELSHAEYLDSPSPFGTPDLEMIEYMAPELLSEHGVASFSSDLWSVGCLLYKMACGHTPFESSTTAETVNKIHNMKVPRLENCSDELNDLVQKLLIKDFDKRPSWSDILGSPFWKGKFKDRESIDLPTQPRIDRNLKYTSMPERISTIILPQIEKEPEPFYNDPEPHSLEDLIYESNLFKPAPILLNPSIEDTVIPKYNLDSLPMKSNLCSSKEEDRLEAANEILELFMKLKDRHDKFPIISFTVASAQNPIIAESISKSQLFINLIKLAEDRNPSLSAGYLLIFAAVVRFSRSLDFNLFTPEKLLPLKNLIESGQQKTARKALMVLSEFTTRISTMRDDKIRYPSWLAELFYETLKSEDHIMRHYSIRTIANVLNYPTGKSLFSYPKIDKAMHDFNYQGSSSLLDTFAICMCKMYMRADPIDANYVDVLYKELMKTKSSTTREIALMLATMEGNWDLLKEDIPNCLSEGTEGLRLKAILVACETYGNDDDLSDFHKIAPRFFSELEKFSLRQTVETEAIAQWCTKIASKVLESDNLKMFQILNQMLNVQTCMRKVWNRDFELMVTEKIPNIDFSSEDSIHVIKLFEIPVREKKCSFSALSSLGAALNSPHPGNQFAVLKLIIDFAPVARPSELCSFVERYVVPVTHILLRNNYIMQDAVLHVLYLAMSGNTDNIPKIATPDVILNVLPLAKSIRQATQLSTLFIEYSKREIEEFMDMGVVNIIVEAVRQRPDPDSYALMNSLMQRVYKVAKVDFTSRCLHDIVDDLMPMISLIPLIAENLFTSSILPDVLRAMISVFSIHVGQKQNILADICPVLSERLIDAANVVENAQWATKVVNEIVLVIKRDGSRYAAREAAQSCRQFLDALKLGINSEYETYAEACKALLKIVS